VDVSWHVNCLSAAQIRLFTTAWMSKLRQRENCMEQLVFLAAVEEELAPLRQRKTDLSKRWQAEISLYSLGVGPIQAAVAAAKIRSQVGLAEWVLLGSCGSYKYDLPLIQPVAPVRHRFGTYCLTQPRSYAPPTAYPTLQAPRFPGLADVLCLTTPGITADDADALAISGFYHADIEHLESYAVLAALAQFNTPCRTLLVPVNRAGNEAAGEYRRNVAAGLEALHGFIAELEAWPWLDP
jgi:hypothetical protein